MNGKSGAWTSFVCMTFTPLTKSEWKFLDKIDEELLMFNHHWKWKVHYEKEKQFAKMESSIGKESSSNFQLLDIPCRDKK